MAKGRLHMAFKLKPTRGKRSASYKTVYLPQNTIDDIAAIAKDNNTSFNNVVVSMIEHCLYEEDDKPAQE